MGACQGAIETHLTDFDDQAVKGRLFSTKKGTEIKTPVPFSVSKLCPLLFMVIQSTSDVRLFRSG